MGEGQNDGWYSDREMFEMIQGLKTDLQETRITVKKYNGLWEKLDVMDGKVDAVDEKIGAVDNRVTTIEQQANGRKSVWQGILSWGGWIFAAGGTVGTIIAISMGLWR